LTIELAIYRDQSKSSRVGTKFVDFRREVIPAVKGFFLSEPPQEVSAGDGFITSPNCTGEWLGREMLYALWNGVNWEFWTLNGDPVYYHVDLKKYFRIQQNLSAMEIQHSTDFRIWDKYFNFSDPSMNVLKSSYSFLKTQQLFSSCGDV